MRGVALRYRQTMLSAPNPAHQPAQRLHMLLLYPHEEKAHWHKLVQGYLGKVLQIQEVRTRQVLAWSGGAR